MFRIKALALAAAFSIFLFAPAFAQDEPVTDWKLAEITTEVPGHPGMYYLDLLKLVIPDLVANENSAKGHIDKPFRNIDDLDMGGQVPDPVGIGGLEVLEFEGEGKPLLAILAGIGEVEELVEQPHILAVFDLSGDHQLVDVADVALDRFTGFPSTARVQIGLHDQALNTISSHFNAGENYSAVALIHLRNGKLALIDSFYGYDTLTCGSEARQAFGFTGVPTSGQPYYDIKAAMHDTRVNSDEDCGDNPPPVAYDRTATTTYKWDAAASKFVADSDAIDKMEAATVP
jgi:hypothetical protein